MRRALRTWTECLESFVLGVIHGERRGKRAAIARFILHCLSNVFLVGVKLRDFLLRRSGRLL